MNWTGWLSGIPERPPTWTEVIIGLLIAITTTLDLLSPSTMSIPGVGIGFLTFAVALGPASTTALGTRIGQWFREIGAAGRATAIILFAIGVAITYRIEAVPNSLLHGIGTGGLLATLLYMTAHIISAGEVSGWKPNRKWTE
ncbi:hypothetical protein [Saliphagus sp. LR7]|uniref:hypothetical protein n=1 Tax=Saliphagus sp. LR7 TaxID=2282654 RepID=UPI000DF737FB|nr:hypothetical protein [Saliphagus sp. LR7]